VPGRPKQLVSTEHKGAGGLSRLLGSKDRHIQALNPKGECGTAGKKSGQSTIIKKWKRKRLPPVSKGRTKGMEKLGP